MTLKHKVAKPKGPVEVERQYGVMLPYGQPCGRSLCCKRHSMKAKRAVLGRSLPYDMLLATYCHGPGCDHGIWWAMTGSLGESEQRSHLLGVTQWSSHPLP